MPIEMCGKGSGGSMADSLEIEGTGGTGAGLLKDMEVDQGRLMAAAAATRRALLRLSPSRSARFDGGGAEETLEGADVGAALEEVDGDGAMADIDVLLPPSRAPTPTPTPTPTPIRPHRSSRFPGLSSFFPWGARGRQRGESHEMEVAGRGGVGVGVGGRGWGGALGWRRGM